MSTSTQFSITVDGDQLNGVVSKPDYNPAATLVMMHGGPGGDMNGPGGLFLALEPRLVDRGFAVVRFDFRGSGKSTIPEGDMTLTGSRRDASAVIAFARQQSEAPVVLVGESMGAMIGMALEEIEVYDAVILLWPALNLYDTDLRPLLTPEAMAETRKVGHYRDDGMELGVGFLEECLTVDVGANLRRAKCEAFIIHGDADTEVPLSHGQRAAAILAERASFTVVSGGDHGLKREGERRQVIEGLENFLTDRYPSHG